MDATEAWFKRNIPSRNWSEICSEWVGFLPSIDPPGSRPLLLSSHLEEFKNVLPGVPATGFIDVNVKGFRELAFQEAVFLLHKASHVIGLGERNANSDIRTWALSDSYHGALFAARACAIFLGIQIVTHNNKNYLIDIFPVQEKSKKQRKPNDEVEVEIRPIRITAFKDRPEHRHHWAIFQRLLKCTSIGSPLDRYLDILHKNIEYKGFAKQRNSIHYNGHFWTFEDIIGATGLPEIVINDTSMAEVLEESEEIGDFSVFLGVLLLKFTKYLFESVVNQSKFLTSELAFLESKLSPDLHPYYHSFQPQTEVE